MKRNNKKYNVALICFVMGIVFLIVFGYEIFSGMIKKASMDSSVEAFNVEIQSYKDFDKTTLYRPIYYYIVDGVEYKYTSSHSTNIGVYKMEIEKTIYYNSANPSEAVSEFEASLKFDNVLLLVVISIFPIVGFIEMKKNK